MKITVLYMFITLIFCFGQVAKADDALVEGDPDYPDNTGPLGTASDNTANIAGEGEEVEVMGTAEGEITLRRTLSAIEVYSGDKKVESVPNDSDGWVGKFPTVSELKISFQPAGRPLLQCPAQNIANWFGPCKMEIHEE